MVRDLTGRKFRPAGREPLPLGHDPARGTERMPELWYEAEGGASHLQRMMAGRRVPQLVRQRKISAQTWNFAAQNYQERGQPLYDTATWWAEAPMARAATVRLREACEDYRQGHLLEALDPVGAQSQPCPAVPLSPRPSKVRSKGRGRRASTHRPHTRMPAALETSKPAPLVPGTISQVHGLPERKVLSSLHIKQTPLCRHVERARCGA